MTRIHLAVPPNIARTLIQDLSRLFPEAEIIPPMTHDEMDHFFTHEFGHEEASAHLTLTAYPQALQRALSPEHTHLFAPMPQSLPPMREELIQIGLKESHPLFRCVCVVPMMILISNQLESSVSGWADLVATTQGDKVVIPPHNTPAPNLFRLYMAELCGETGVQFADSVHATLLPQDINKSIDEGTYLAGMAFPAFARTSRGGNTQAIWPKEGAVAIPLMALIRKDAPKEAQNILNALFSHDIQNRLAREGLFVSVRDDVPLIDEMIENQNTLAWCGWNRHITACTPSAM